MSAAKDLFDIIKVGEILWKMAYLLGLCYQDLRKVWSVRRGCHWTGDLQV